ALSTNPVVGQTRIMCRSPPFTKQLISLVVLPIPVPIAKCPALPLSPPMTSISSSTHLSLLIRPPLINLLTTFLPI
ncbi:17844_t:CDS:1, partial [Racocetra persica]